MKPEGEIDPLFFGSVGPTAIIDNAALTYLGSLVEGVSDELKYTLVGSWWPSVVLTVIANAPNPIGIGILQNARVFGDEASGKMDQGPPVWQSVH